VRLTIELWQYRRLQTDRLVVSRQLERTLTYNVVTKEYKVSAIKGETRPVYTTRELRDAQRVLSDARAAKLAAASSLDPADVIYVRVKAETALNGENTFFTRMAGHAEQIASATSSSSRPSCSCSCSRAPPTSAWGRPSCRSRPTSSCSRCSTST
jgi:hypothetical protein